jgi:CBS domain-containing protein
MRITDICTRDVVHIGPTASVRDAAELMRNRHVGSLVVVEQPNGECFPIGMLTDRDITVGVVSMGADAANLTVADLMSRALVSCAEQDDLFAAIQSMRRHGVRRLPVLDGNGALCGLVSADDIVSAIGWHLADLSAALRAEQVHEMQVRPDPAALGGLANPSMAGRASAK